jgi:hypothetical protein
VGNINVAATQDFIREVHVATGAEPDPVAIPAVLETQKEHHGVVPPKFVYDGAAGAGKYFAAVARITEGQTQLVAPPIPRIRIRGDHPAARMAAPGRRRQLRRADQQRPRLQPGVPD